jgi:hypothetical protein
MVATTSIVRSGEGGLALYSDELASAFQDQFGLDHLEHHGAPGRHVAQVFQAMGHDPGGAALLSTIERWERGMTTAGGSSSDDDVETGGAFGVFVRMRRPGMVGASSSYPGEFVMQIDPREMGRLDAFSNHNDRYGRVGEIQDRLYPLAGTSRIGMTNETMFRGSIPARSIQRVLVSRDTRASLLEDLRSAGVTSIGGRPIEEVFVAR